MAPEPGGSSPAGDPLAVVLGEEVDAFLQVTDGLALGHGQPRVVGAPQYQLLCGIGSWAASV
jgi:hypothetical protein